MRLNVLDEIAAAAGNDAAMALARRFGGTVIRVPITTEALMGQRWYREISKDAAAVIGREFSGQNLYIPMANEQVARWLAEQGLDAATIATELRVSVRTVQRWKQSLR